MMQSGTAAIDVVIFGGGAAGLWTLDELVRAGHRAVLLESGDLGSGQTISSQGIIHGGLKYSLSGMLTRSARAIREMPAIWRQCLAGEREPDLSSVLLRSAYCHLWHTGSLASRAAMIGARAGLRTAPVLLEPVARPEVLQSCPGIVARLDEQVIEPASFIAALANRHVNSILQIDHNSGLEIDIDSPGRVKLIRILNPSDGEPLDFQPQNVILAAGAGNAELRRRFGLEDTISQLRPLHMVVIRGKLPQLNGHCVDGIHTRATITTVAGSTPERTWQVGGQIAEDGVAMQPDVLIKHARSELMAILPGLNLTHAKWMTYRMDRAEPATSGSKRPAEYGVRVEGSIITCWPTKLALVPRMVSEIQQHLPPPVEYAGDESGAMRQELTPGWDRPAIAAPPWEEDQVWRSACSAEPV